MIAMVCFEDWFAVEGAARPGAAFRCVVPRQTGKQENQR